MRCCTRGKDNKKALSILRSKELWQREKDSNPHIRSQSPLCYLYTIPLNASAIILHFFRLSSIFYNTRKNIFRHGTFSVLIRYNIYDKNIYDKIRKMIREIHGAPGFVCV